MPKATKATAVKRFTNWLSRSVEESKQLTDQQLRLAGAEFDELRLGEVVAGTVPVAIQRLFTLAAKRHGKSPFAKTTQVSVNLSYLLIRESLGLWGKPFLVRQGWEVAWTGGPAQPVLSKSVWWPSKLESQLTKIQSENAFINPALGRPEPQGKVLAKLSPELRALYTLCVNLNSDYHAAQSKALTCQNGADKLKLEQRAHEASAKAGLLEDIFMLSMIHEAGKDILGARINSKWELVRPSGEEHYKQALSGLKDVTEVFLKGFEATSQRWRQTFDQFFDS